MNPSERLWIVIVEFLKFELILTPMLASWPLPPG